MTTARFNVGDRVSHPMFALGMAVDGNLVILIIEKAWYGNAPPKVGEDIDGGRALAPGLSVDGVISIYH